MKKSKRGGYREGSGRKPKEPTVLRRIPESIVTTVDQMIIEHRAKLTETS